MEELFLVGTEKDAIVAVPLEGCETDAGVLSFDDGHIHGIKFLYVIAPGINKIRTAIIAVRIIIAVTTFEELESWNDLVELNLLLGDDAELVLGTWVELDFDEVIPVL